MPFQPGPGNPFKQGGKQYMWQETLKGPGTVGVGGKYYTKVLYNPHGNAGHTGGGPAAPGGSTGAATQPAPQPSLPQPPAGQQPITPPVQPPMGQQPAPQQPPPSWPTQGSLNQPIPGFPDNSGSAFPAPTMPSVPVTPGYPAGGMFNNTPPPANNGVFGNIPNPGLGGSPFGNPPAALPQQPGIYSQPGWWNQVQPAPPLQGGTQGQTAQPNYMQQFGEWLAGQLPGVFGGNWTNVVQ